MRVCLLDCVEERQCLVGLRSSLAIKSLLCFRAPLHDPCAAVLSRVSQLEPVAAFLHRGRDHALDLGQRRDLLREGTESGFHGVSVCQCGIDQQLEGRDASVALQHGEAPAVVRHHHEHVDGAQSVITDVRRQREEFIGAVVCQ